jgi:hypothetical protein
VAPAGLAAADVLTGGGDLTWIVLGLACVGGVPAFIVQ